MVRVVTQTSHGSSRLKFGTGEAEVTLFQKIYALMQCTPDLSQQDCEYCLSQCLSYFQTCCFVLWTSCFLRWDLYPFYTSTADDDDPSPPPSSSQLPNTTSPPPPSPFRTSSEVVLLILVIIFSFVCLRRKNSKKKKKKNTNADGNDNTVESLQFDFNTIIVATNNFSIDNKLGEGGFGVVYKGRLPDGQDVAVKRLSNNSGQGEVEIKNEAWERWRKGTALDLIDPILRADCSTSEIMRCIHIGLLCVQENVSNRPNMASVVLMLTSCSISLQVPTKPAFFMHTTTDLDTLKSTSLSNGSKVVVEWSVNESSISELDLDEDS
ncbi:hypothetical protein LWI28_014333 [Acer negundo]|uniref:Gnk2-homologous domain-containing protein n=1 Tax=Acer negundo TaxID=4023 RepID=A0AAD5NXF9_ACENE|nr:hypothetical protein LWI28_014333 [Acer negundo]